MKNINKILILTLLFIGIFAFKQDVYAEWIYGYTEGKIEFNIYNEETNQFKKQNSIVMYLEDGTGVLEPYPGTMYKDDEVYVIDNKVILLVPQKEGYYFSGWYLDENYQTSFLTSKITTSFKDMDLKLYGKWVKDKPNNTIYTYGKDVYLFTVVNNCSYIDGCSRYGEYLYVKNNSYISNEKETLSTIPTLTKENDKFIGWYQEKSEVENSNSNQGGCINYTGKINDTSFESIAKLNVDGRTTIYANWESDKCNLIGDSNNNTDDTTNTIGATTSKEDKDNKDDNTLLYTIIGGACGLVVGCIVVALMKKNKNNQEV